MYGRYKENLCNVKGISFVETDLKKINKTYTSKNRVLMGNTGAGDNIGRQMSS